MLAPTQVLAYVKAQPFRPFRIHMASGKTFEVRRPEMIKVGKNVVMVFRFAPGEEELVKDWETASLMLAESISHLDASSAA